MDLTYDLLAELVGDELVVVATDGATEVEVPLVVDAATPAGSGGSVLLTGAADQALGQGTYVVRLPEQTDTSALFVVPVAERDGRRVYEAVFG